ncbi:hypothetical protein Taro_051372, partial [Colocasia esculenta]|nr:hypothetical protein [Colocasia esculenta]
VETGARLVSRACGLWVPLLAASGGGLVAVVVTAFSHDTRASGGFCSVSSRFRSLVLGCQSVMAPACVASRPCGMSTVRGGSACGPSTLWRSEVAVVEPVRDWSSVSDGLRRRLWRRVLSAAVRASVVSSCSRGGNLPRSLPEGPKGQPCPGTHVDMLTEATETPEVHQVLSRPPHPSRYHRNGKGNRDKRVTPGKCIATTRLSRQGNAPQQAYHDRAVRRDNSLSRWVTGS